jgi:hypothetical protein
MEFEDKVRLAVALAAAKIAAGKVAFVGLDLDEAGAIVESYQQLEKAIERIRGLNGGDEPMPMSY